MKFSVAALLAAVGATVDATKLAGKKVFDGRKLLKNAIPVDKDGNRRRLNDNEFEITGEYSIQFNHCISLKAEAEDQDLMFGEDTIAYTANGQILAEKSYVLFNVCQTEYCYYESEEMMYMVDLETYMGSLLEIKQQAKEDYCEACDYDYCYPEEEEQEQQQQEEDGGDGEEEQAEDENQDGGRRKMQQWNNVIYTTCNQCEAYGCFDDEQEEQNNYNGNQQQAIQDEDILEWAQGMAECQEIENGYWNGMELYGGFMCNADGDGVEVAVFLDNDCTVYTTTQSYSALVAGTYDYQYLYGASDIVTYPFLNDIDCLELEYVNPGDVNDDQQQEEDNGEGPESNEFCRQLVENAVDMDTCGGWEDDGNDQEEEQGDDEFNYDWYTYVVRADDADDLQAVCKVVEEFQGEFSNAHTYTETDSENGGGSGHVYDYKSSSANGSGAFNAGKVFGIIIAIVVVIVAGVMVVQSCGSKRDSKKVPLVNKNSGGAMA